MTPEESAGRGKQRVVVGVDGSSDSSTALAWAAAEAKLRGGLLEVIHSCFFRVEIDSWYPAMFDRERQVLDAAVAEARRLQPELEVQGRLAEPPPAEALIQASRGAALLVVGSRGLGGIGDYIIGSVSNRCVHRAHCPVVVVRPAESDREEDRVAQVA